MAHFNKPSRIPIEQDSDPTPSNFKREMLGLPSDNQVLISNLRYNEFSRNRKRIILREDIFYRQH